MKIKSLNITINYKEEEVSLEVRNFDNNKYGIYKDGVCIKMVDGDLDGMETIDDIVMDVQTEYEWFMDECEEREERERCIYALNAYLEREDMDGIYKLICSLHSCEGAAQQNIYDYISNH